MSTRAGLTRLLRRWEDLPIGAQLAVAGPVLVVVVFLAHVALFPNLSTGLAASYGLFWGALAAVAIVGASRSERARRIQRDRANHGRQETR